MAYVTDAELRTYFAAHMGLASEGDLELRYITLITRANTAAYNCIVAKLLERGFSASQVASWDQGDEFNLDLACCWLLRTALKSDADDRWQLKFCRQSELETIPIIINGALVDPAGSAVGVAYGDMEHVDDEFSRDVEW